jgi:hypothetical protein
VPKIDANLSRLVFGCWFIPLCGVGWCLLTANFPLVDIEFKSSGLGSVSASISYPSGFVFPPPFWVVG